MSLKFRYIPLSFLSDNEQIKTQIKNTIILKHYFDLNNSTIKLSKVIEGTQYGYNASALITGDNKFLRISDITDGKVDWESVPYCDCLNEKTYLLKQDDILIARTGGTTGKSFLINDPPEKSIFAGYLIRIRANKESNPEFLNLFLNSYVYWSQITSLNKGEFRPSINSSKLKALLLPKCTEQQQLDAIQISKGYLVKGYEKLQAEIEKVLLDYEKCKEIVVIHSLQKKITNNLKQSILQDAIEGELTKDWRKENPTVESASELLKLVKAEKAQMIKDEKIRGERVLPAIVEEDIPFNLPKGWEWCRFSDLVNFQIGKTPPSKRFEYWDDGSVNWLNIRDMVDGGFIKKTTKKITQKAIRDVFKSHEIVEPNTLLMSFKLTVGKISINEIPLFHNEAILSIFPFMNIDKMYLFYLLPKITELSASKRVLMGYTFNSTSLSNMIFPLAPLEEQKAIVQKVETLLQKCTALEQEIAQSEANAEMLMQAVLKEAFEWKGKNEGVEMNVISKSAKPTNIDYYKRILLAAEIVWQLHKEPTLGHLKLQKIIYLAQESSSMQLPTNFIQQAAGPYDPVMARSLDKQLKLKRWFEYQKNDFPKYKPLANAGEHREDFWKYFEKEIESIQYIIDCFKTAKSDSIEIAATLYACWKELLSENHIISDELLIKRFYEWSEEKSRFKETRLIKAMRWMEKKGIVPRKNIN